MSQLLENIADFLQRPRNEQTDVAETNPTALAAAVLLVEMARQDFDYDTAERNMIANLVRDHFELAPREAAALVAHAEAEEENAPDDFEYRQTIKQNFSLAERKAIIEMLWKVAMSDGVFMPQEATLIYRIGQSIGLSDDEIAAIPA